MITSKSKYKLQSQIQTQPAPQLHKLFGDFVQTRPWTFVLCAVLLLVAFPCEQIAFPEVYGRLVDAVSKSPKNIIQSTWKLLLASVMLLVFAQIFFVIIDYIDAYLQPALLSYYRERVLENIIQTFEQKYKTLEIGHIISKVSKLPLIIKHLYHQIKTYILPALIVSFFACIYFFYLNIELGIVTFVSMILFYFSFWYLARQCVASSQQRDQLLDVMNENIDDTLSNLLSVYTSTSVKAEIKHFQNKQQNHDEQFTNSSLCGVNLKVWFSVFYIA